MKQGTAKVACTCLHKDQDVLHGNGVRVANSTQKGDNVTTEVRCTVCGKVHRVPDSRIR